MSCIAFSPSGDHVVIGKEDGMVAVATSGGSFDVLFSVQVGSLQRAARGRLLESPDTPTQHRESTHARAHTHTHTHKHK